MYNAKAKKMVSALLIASMVTFGAGFTNINSESNKANAVQQIQPLQGKVVMVPAGTAIPATATMELSSENLHSVRAYVLHCQTTFITTIHLLPHWAAL